MIILGWRLRKSRRYNHLYFLVYTNTPGEIVYEDQYQIAARADVILQIEDVQPSWSLEE